MSRATAADQLWSSPATSTSVCMRAHSPPFLQHTASQHRHAPNCTSYWGGGGGGCSGDTFVTQACSVYPAVCFNGSLFLYTPIIMYIYHALINALSAHMIHINLNVIFYTHVKHSPTKTLYIKYYLKIK